MDDDIEISKIISIQSSTSHPPVNNMSFYVKEEDGRDQFYVRYSQRIKDQPTAKCRHCGVESLKKDLIECADNFSWRNIFLHKVCYEPFMGIPFDDDDDEGYTGMTWEEYHKKEEKARKEAVKKLEYKKK